MLGVGLQILRARDIAGGLQFMQPLFQSRQFIHPAGGDVEDRFVAVRFGLLRQITHHGPFIALDRAGVRLLLLENDGEEGGLARAIRPDQRDAVAVVHLKRGVFEEHPPAQGHF